MLTLTGAFGPYDRTEALRSGSVRPERIDLTCLTLYPPEIFYRMCRYQEFEVSEMSMGSHCFFLGQGESPFVGIPAFPSRVFRHSMVYVNNEAGIERPEELSGRRIAIREWGQTAFVWIIGILAEEYGLDILSVDWVQESEPRVPLRYPAGMRIRTMQRGETLSGMLDSGAVDAALIHQVPACYRQGSPRVRRLFEDFKVAEVDYYRRTGVFPIMHCAVVRADVHRRAPWALRSFYRALCEAKALALENIQDYGALSASVPLLPAVMEETREIFGEDFWPYGMEANRKTVEKVVLYAHQQGLTPRRLEVEELFGESVRGDSFLS
ncbi:MAG TPA: 4,5-dihydroxyphthalate decarboxylase [Nitrospinae bacterium]|jgi:4,5-dihydroxyphthalate decarboxylase|nr:4,5-dihydroxyphthalate decarboxylase [Nitrospinota bacterium]